MSEKKKNWIARVLDSDTVRKIAPSSWVVWRKTTEAYWGTGYRAGEKPPKSGDLLVQSPYSDWYNLIWGLAPSQDMPKWRWMYRARPEIRRGIDTKVILAVGRGFEVICEESEKIERFANDLVKKLNIRDILQNAVTDMLVYGTSYFEKVRVKEGEEQESEKQVQKVDVNAQVTRDWRKLNLDDGDKDTLKSWLEDVNKIDSWNAERIQRPEEDRSTIQNGDGELVELKTLDPLWMRVNRDAFGNILGFVQWGLTPIPQSILAEKIVFLRWMPKSWAHENAYGTSILMPVQRHVSLLIQAEEDMKVYWHQYAKPMLVVKAGTQEKPYPVPKLTYLRDQFAARQPNTDAIVPGDVTVETIVGGMASTTPTFEAYTNYLREKIYETIGVPSILMNLPGQNVRATSDVALQAFIAEEQMIQQIVAEQFLKQVIEPEVRKKFGGDSVLSIVWPPVLEEDRNKKADRITKMVGRPIMSVNEGRAELGLKARPEEEYDEISEQSQPGFGQLSKNPEDSENTRTGDREEGLQKRDRGQE